MDGDRESQALLYRDKPAERIMQLFGPHGRDYDANESQAIGDRFEKLQANEPEMIRNVDVYMDREVGRLAVGMLVYGDHATLQGRAADWLAVLRDTDEQSLQYSWRIGH